MVYVGRSQNIAGVRLGIHVRSHASLMKGGYMFPSPSAMATFTFKMPAGTASAIQHYQHALYVVTARQTRRSLLIRSPAEVLTLGPGVVVQTLPSAKGSSYIHLTLTVADDRREAWICCLPVSRGTQSSSSGQRAHTVRHSAV